MRWSAIALLFFAVACTTTTTFTHTGTGIFAPHDDASDEEEAPRGLSLYRRHYGTRPDRHQEQGIRIYGLDLVACALSE